jgi:TonB family protein
MKTPSKQKESITREPQLSPITLKELYEKIANREFEHPIKLFREEKKGKGEAFEILTTLGKGRTTFTLLSLYNKKFTALRMSYNDEDFTGKFDSIIEETGDDYKRFFLDTLYSSVPVQRLHHGDMKKKNEIVFDKTVYVSFWEKAEALLANKRAESFEKKFKWFREFLDGLRIIHSKSRAHFDIKLENLFLVNNRLKIGDFEFYWKIKDFIDAKEYLYCGSIGYIAPEMFYDRENITSKVDIFSAGAAFARLFTGETYRNTGLNPEDHRQIKEILQKCESLDRFDRTHLAEIKESLCHSFFYRRLVMDKIENETLPAPEKFLYREILLEMMNPDPENRPDIHEIIAKLKIKEPAVKHAGRTGHIGPQKPPTLRRFWFIAAILVLAAAGLFSYFFVINPVKSRAPSRAADIKLIVTPPVKDIPKKVEPVKTVKPQPAKKIEPEIPLEEKEKIKEQAKYETILDIARDLVRKKEYKKALEMIARAREIKEDDELWELEETVKQLMENEVQDGYERFYNDARRAYERGDYEEALRNIEFARQIKDTPQSVSLQLQIKRKIEEKEEEYERGLALVERNIFDEEYANAKEIIDALKKIKADDRLLKMEREVNQKLAEATRQRQEAEREYMKYLQKAQEYMDNGDFEKAQEEIKKAGSLKNTPLLKRLEEKLNDLQEQTQQEYEKYCKWARVYFDNGQPDKARYYLELAKKIYPSQELWVLEREIREKTREQAREETAKKADDEAYFNALRRGKVWDIDEYLRKYPQGRHAAEAKEKLNAILERLIPHVEEPRLIKKVEPVYHRKADRKGIPGIVRLEVVIDKYGNVKEAEVIEGHQMLRYAVIKAVKQWKYEPVIIGGEPRTVWFRVRVLFGSAQSGD